MNRAVERAREALASSPTVNDKVPAPDKHFSKNAARSTVAVAVLVAVGGFCILLQMASGPQSAFAQVQTALAQVPCITFDAEILEAPNNVVARSGTQIVDLAGNRYRYELADNSWVSVYNGTQLLHLDRKRKRAVIISNQSPSPMPSFASFLKNLRDCDPDTVRRLPDGEFDERTVQRYRISPDAPISQGATTTVFVDPATHLPVRIESITDGAGDARFHVVCNNFSFDERDPALFSLIAPEGYEVEEHLAQEP